MALEKTISMEPVKLKLKEIKKYMKKEDEMIYGFASYLAGKLNPELNPEGFVITCELALEDLNRGEIMENMAELRYLLI